MSYRGLRIAIATVVASLFVVGTQASPASAAPTLPLKVNFGAATTTTPSGYTADIGAPYSATTGFGWTDTAGAPLSLVGNGRERAVNADKRLDTFVHMQLNAPGSAGVPTEGRWKAEVPNGSYQVTVAVGDPSYTDSRHVINVEGVRAIDFTPTTANTNSTATVTANVTDGFVDIDQTGGTNTKINYIEIAASTTNPGSPTITAVTPENVATNVSYSTGVTIQLSDGVDPTTANATNFKLLGPGGTQVDGFYNTDGAYSNATFQPAQSLATNTTYTVQTTTGIKTPTGQSYPAFTSTFTTGTTGIPPSPVEFEKSLFDTKNAPTALALGPDGKLYTAFGDGTIYAYTLDADGKRVGAPVEITAFKLNRIVSAIKFDPASTANNLTLWVSNGQFGCDLAALGVACNDFTGMVSKLTGTSASNLVRTDVVTGLPRSVGNHMNNGFDFGPDGAMYLAVGANTGYGDPDPIWGNRAEVPLAAAILRIDYATITAPYSVNTSTGYNYTAATAKVKPYVTGIRNPFSVLAHSNGKLYSPVNESASGNTPADPAGGAPALTNLPSFNDYFTQLVAGKYYGHPNPARGEYRLNGGNPTAGVDPFEVPQYAVGTQPNANWYKPDLDLGPHRSPDGITEFKSNVFGGTLKGSVLVTEYAGGKDIIAIGFDANGKPTAPTQVMSGFNNPLPIVSDPVSGRVYVGEYGEDPTGEGGKIDLLTPKVTTTPPGTTKVNFQTETTSTPVGYLADFGAAYNAQSGYGWVDQTSGQPLSLIGNGRERNVATDKRLDTFVSMQLPPNSPGVPTPGKWELALANGNYTINGAVGDPSYTDSVHVINAEGTNVVNYTPTSTATNKTFTANVAVADGKLTLDAIGGTNTKLNYIEVVPTATGGDTTKPVVAVTPSGTTDTSGNYVGSATVTIDATDEAGGSGVASKSYTLNGGNATAYSTPLTLGVGTHTIVATATDVAGNISLPVTKTINVVSGTTPTFSKKVNFGLATTATPAGYVADTGLAYDAARSYGWETLSGAALDKSAEARERGVLTDKRLDAFVHIARPTTTEGRWQLDVPNGTYNVTVSVGDPSYTDSVHIVRAEGTGIINFTPTAATPHQSVTASVTVADGKLTLDQVGGTNTKINYVDVVSATASGDATKPTVTVTPSGTTDASGNYVNTAAITIAATDNAGGSGVASVSYTLDGGAATAYTAPFNVGVGSHAIVATATDVAGNISLPVTKTVNVVTGGGTPSFDKKFNFQPPSSATPAGYIAETGLTYSATRGYGWESLTGAANNTTDEARERNLVADKRLDTLIIMQLAGATEGRWQLDVPNGTYNLTGAVGDPSTTAGTQVLRAEGTQIISYTPTSSAPQKVFTATVTVADGKLTIDAVGGTSTKIAYLDVVSTSTGSGDAASINVTTPEERLQLGKHLVFSTVATEARPGHNLTIQNTGTTPLNVTGINFGGTDAALFQLCSGQTAVFSVATGASKDVCVQYRPTVQSQTAGTYTSKATLTITSNAPSQTVTIAGLNAQNYEDVNEPNLQQVFDGLGYKNTVPVANLPVLDALSPTSAALGPDEVISAYWKKADASKPTSLIPLAHYARKSNDNSTTFGLYAKGTPYVGAYSFLGGTADGGANQGYGQNQLLLPKTTNNNYDFNIAGSFAFGDGQGTSSDDNLVPNGGWHDVRIFQAKDQNGVAIPNTYIVADDYGFPQNNPGKNFDYNDYVFLMTNAMPDGGNDQPVVGEIAKTLEFVNNEGGLADTGFTTSQGTYTQALVARSGGKLNITTSATANTNALQLPVNSATDFRIQSRLVGPFTAISAGNERQGIYYGPDASNFLRISVEWNPTANQRQLVIYKMQSGVGAVVGSVAMPAGTINTIDFRIDVTPATYDNASGPVPPHAAFYYATNGSTAFTKINATVAQGNVPSGNVSMLNGFITARTPAGVTQSHSGTGGAAFTASYENFIISRRY